MSLPPPQDPVYDPYNFPNYTQKTIARDITFIIFGAAIYEAFITVSTYISICNKAKLKTVIFQLITFAVFPLVLSIIFSIIIQVNQTPEDIVLPQSEYVLTVLNIILQDISKFGYYIAATLRTKVLLKRYPKVMYFFYAMLATCIISNLVLCGLIIKVNTLLVNSTPMTFFQVLPEILDIMSTFVGASTFVTIFDMIFANFLIVSFLYPIFTNLNMNFTQAIRAMIKLGDVQKALVATAASIVYPIISQGEFKQLTLPIIMFWLSTQNTLFLRLSYFSTSQLLPKQSSMKTVLTPSSQVTKSKDALNSNVSKDTGSSVRQGALSAQDYV